MFVTKKLHQGMLAFLVDRNIFLTIFYCFSPCAADCPSLQLTEQGRVCNFLFPLDFPSVLAASILKVHFYKQKLALSVDHPLFLQQTTTTCVRTEDHQSDLEKRQSKSPHYFQKIQYQLTMFNFTNFNIKVFLLVKWLNKWVIHLA